MDRRLFIVIAVVGFHVLGLWALQTGLLRRAVELVVPVQVLAELIELPQPQVTPTPAAPQPAPVPQRVTPTKPVPRQAAQPIAVAEPVSAEPAPTGTTEPQPPAPTMPVAVAEPAQPAPPKIEQPSSSAEHLNNAPPPYPPLSKRLGEQGKVIVRAFIEVNGTASKAEIRSSSGYDRLDQTALQTVLKWRYVPGKRAGAPEAMWFNIPINFVLE